MTCDEITGVGPLGGLHAGLGSVSTPYAFVIACDMPFLSWQLSTEDALRNAGRFLSEGGAQAVKLEGGYVKNVSEEFLKKQQELIGRHVAEADLVITTALIPGKKAPVLIPEDMVKNMRMGSVIVDMAVEQGGNCTLSELNQTVTRHGVIIIGESNIPSRLPLNASELYAKNIAEFLRHLTTSDGFKWEMEEEITKGSLIVHKGSAVHPSVAGHVNA